MSRTRSHRPALVEAKDLTGAPRGRHSAKISPSVSSASSGGEAKSRVLPSSGEDKGRGLESCSPQIGIGTPNRSSVLDHSGGVPEDLQLGPEVGVRRVPEYSEGPNIPEGDRSGSNADSSSRSPNATARGNSVSASRSTDGDASSDVLSSKRLLLPVSSDEYKPAESVLAPTGLQSELLDVPTRVLPTSTVGKQPSSPRGTVGPPSRDAKEGTRPSSEEQSQPSSQQKGKGTKLGTSSQGVDKRTPTPMAHANLHASCRLACAPARHCRMACRQARHSPAGGISCRLACLPARPIWVLNAYLYAFRTWAVP
ncbi:hypothetical protein PGT21_024213 [Puccinia graminis f. sp. tritici]|uniref:Uncharacterized protein n=1 Tax=Puccinia graminis f. sp. tritici TaxID=56615 RepID=A0A5B0M569_PUCGR|nr:hypothetical protein PGT21_024213 [Puccinia graminis f. sp. tritici]